MGAAAGRFLGVRLRAEVGACVEAGAGRFLGVRCGAGVGECMGAWAGCFLGLRHGVEVGTREGAGAGAEGGSLGASSCLHLCLPGTGGGIITRTARGLTGARSRIGVASGLAARAAALSLSAVDSVLALVDSWLAGMYASSAVGAPISGS